MKRTATVLAGILLVAACHKEPKYFPTLSELQGIWVGKNRPYTLLFESDTMTVTGTSEMDTFSYTYTLNETRRTIDVIQLWDTASQYYGISINEQKNQLTLYGMFTIITTIDTDFIKQ